MPVAEASERSSRGGAGVHHSSAGDDQGASGRTDDVERALQGGPLGGGATDMPDAAIEERDRPVVGLGLDVLRERDGHGAGVGNVGEDPHGVQERGDELLGAVDAVKEPRHRPERVIHRDVERARILELLQHGIGPPRGELITGEEQDRDPVGGRQGCAGDHVRRARADRGGDRHRLHAVPRAGEGGRRVGGPLFVAGEEIGDVAVRERVGRRIGTQTILEGDLVLQQGLAHPGDVAVPEDPEHAGNEPVFDAVSLGPLRSKEADEGLAGRQSQRVSHGNSLSRAGQRSCTVRSKAY